MSDNLRGRRVVIRPDNRIETECYLPRPPKPGEVLIKTERTLISAGTELGLIDEKREKDLYPGYSNVGRILALGEGVAEHAIGDRVLSVGYHGTHVTVPGAAPWVTPIPESLPSEEAAFGILGSVAAHGARRARVEPGEHVCITGMGLVGQLALQHIAQTGCETVTAVDLSDGRLQIARALGATHTLNSARDALTEAAKNLTEGRLFDCIIEASGYPALLPLLFDITRNGGRVILLGSIWHRSVEIDFMPFHLKELTLISAHQPLCPTTATLYFPWTQQYNRQQALKMLADGRLKARPLMTHNLSFEAAGEAYTLLRNESDRTLGVVLTFDP